MNQNNLSNVFGNNLVHICILYSTLFVIVMWLKNLTFVAHVMPDESFCHEKKHNSKTATDGHF